MAPWHVRRYPLTRLADALAELTAAFGIVGANVAVLARPEARRAGRRGGRGSSAMPHKANPVRAVLLNAAARQAPLLAAQLHQDAATVDERPDGAWHAEWQTLRQLLRTAGGAAATGRELAEGLRVHPDAVAANLAAAGPGLLSEAARYTDSPPDDPAGYLGDAAELTARLVAATRKELA
ncbi:MAG: hypothetical protein R2717_05555 [Schumannella sp.]